MWKKLTGIIGSTLELGFAGNAIQHHADGIAIRNNADDANKNLVVARPQGTNKDLHASTFADTKERVILIEWSFDGGTPPTPGDHTGQYGLCHTSGGSYNAGEVWFDDGAAVTLVTPYKMLVLMTKVSVAGTVNLIDEGLYIAQSGSAPYSWTLKGDGTPNYTGVERIIMIDIPAATAGNYDATTAIPEDARITKVITKIITPFDAGTLTVLVHGSSDLTVQTTAENDTATAGTYETGDYEEVTSSFAGPPRVTIVTAASGAAEVYVHYTVPLV
jgi:hypothetical protein